MTDAYVLLPENRTAYDTVSTILTGNARSTRTIAQPVTLCGPSGSGKTSLLKHLVRAESRKPGGAVVFQTGLEWADEYRRADRDGRTADWLHKLSKVQRLIIDGIDAVGRHAAVAEQAVSAIDEVAQRSGRVVLTMNSLPGRQRGFSSRLADRIRGGTLLTFENLSEKSVAKLVSQYASARQMVVEAEALDRLLPVIGKTPGDVIRAVDELEKLTIRRGSNVTLQIAGEFVRRAHGGTLSIPQITKAVAKEFSARVSDLRAAGRSQSVVVPRQTAMFLAREIAGEQYQAIGEYFGRRNHSTVVHSVRRVAKMLDDSPEFASRVVQIRSELGLNG